MILIAENINVMSQTIGPALKERKAEPIKALAKAQTDAGVHYLDLNIGPSKKFGAELMPWLVNIVQEVSDLPLSLDTTNVVAIEEGLKVCKKRPLINSISLQPDRLDQELELVKKYNAEMIGLLWGVDGMPRDANERAMHTVDLVYKANEKGIANDAIWIDPIVTPISGEINQVTACFESLGMLKDIAPGCKSVVGLSNVSNGTPDHLRPILNRTYLIMLMRQGLYAAIVDAFDKELQDIAMGRKPNLVSIVHRAMDGEAIDMAGISKEERDYVKSVRVLTGQQLFSHSWLEV
jgi:5-methyltetrahydrofolate corrinoid/iron sulfur protein methyltransferase